MPKKKVVADSGKGPAKRKPRKKIVDPKAAARAAVVKKLPTTSARALKPTAQFNYEMDRTVGRAFKIYAHNKEMTAQDLLEAILREILEAEGIL